MTAGAKFFAVTLAAAALAVTAAAVAAVGPSPFSDISGHEHETEIGLAQHKGLFHGYGDNTFRPDAVLTNRHAEVVLGRLLDHYNDDDGTNTLTRAQAAVVLTRGVCGLDGDCEDAGPVTRVDDPPGEDEPDAPTTTSPAAAGWRASGECPPLGVPGVTASGPMEVRGGTGIYGSAFTPSSVSGHPNRWTFFCVYKTASGNAANDAADACLTVPGLNPRDYRAPRAGRAGGHTIYCGWKVGAATLNGTCAKAVHPSDFTGTQHFAYRLDGWNTAYEAIECEQRPTGQWEVTCQEWSAGDPSGDQIRIITTREPSAVICPRAGFDGMVVFRIEVLGPWQDPAPAPPPTTEPPPAPLPDCPEGQARTIGPPHICYTLPPPVEIAAGQDKSVFYGQTVSVRLPSACGSYQWWADRATRPDQPRPGHPRHRHLHRRRRRLVHAHPDGPLRGAARAAHRLDLLLHRHRRRLRRRASHRRDHLQAGPRRPAAAAVHHRALDPAAAASSSTTSVAGPPARR